MILPTSSPSDSASSTSILSQRLSSKSWQHEARLVDIFIVVSAQLLLFFLRPTPKRCLKISVCVLGADHEPNLARWVGGDGSVGIFDGGEDFLARGLERGNEREVEPLVLRCVWLLASKRDGH